YEQAIRLLEENDRRLAPVYQRVATSKRATSLIFEGTGSVDEVKRVIGVLRANTGLATFFVTRAQMMSEMDMITTIVQSGEQVGILIDPAQMTDVELTCELLETGNILQTTYGYMGNMVIRPAYGLATEPLLESASALGWPVIAHTFLATPETVWRLGNPETIYEQVFSEAMPSLQRGGIALFQLGVFARDDVLGNYVRHLIEIRNPYPVTLVTDVIRDTMQLYTYPLPERQIMDDVRDTIYSGHTTYATVLDRITGGYIGLDGQNKEALMPGFTYLERDALNTKGIVRNESDRVFLTFQGWGSDVAVEAILTVLANHHAHATFFLQTEYAAANPNLVRGIAADGHDIGTMTHTGVKLAEGLDDDTLYVELDDRETDALREDLVTSYDTLMHICGDMTSDSARPSLTTYMRPPDLAVSRSGLEVVFDLGFTYCILGSYDCEDDEAKRAQDLADDMRKNTKTGSVLILRLSDDCIYTAEALDIYLRRIEADKHYRFDGLSMELR
ncbi:MAG: polysaccharide deacetylase family protein, partial [Clostridia bacterium]|nr:polysaccharide deacetylase family protein [Clostridia bacterium]